MLDGVCVLSHISTTSIYKSHVDNGYLICVGPVKHTDTINTPFTCGERIFYHDESEFVTGSIHTETGRECYSVTTSTKIVVTCMT